MTMHLAQSLDHALTAHSLALHVPRTKRRVRQHPALLTLVHLLVNARQQVLYAGPDLSLCTSGPCHCHWLAFCGGKEKKVTKGPK